MAGKSVLIVLLQVVLMSLVACYVTVPTREVADRIAHSLVGKRLAACVNILPGVSSVYSWQGAIRCDDELMLMIKSRATLVPEIIVDVRANHTYDVPEVISVPIGDGHREYLQWVYDSTRCSATEEEEMRETLARTDAAPGQDPDDGNHYL